MTLNELDILLRQPQLIKGDESTQLKAIIDQYPYFQSVRSLYLKSLYANKSYVYNQELKTTAAHTLDRDILFDFIISPDFITYQPLQIKTEEIVVSKEVALEEIITTETQITTNENIPLEPSSFAHLQEDNIVIEESSTIDNTTVEEVIIEEPIVIEKEVLVEEIELEEDPKKEIAEPKLTSTAIKSLLQSITIHENQQLYPPIKEEVSDTPTAITQDNTTTSVSEDAEQTKVEITLLEEKLEIGAPLNFDDKEKMSFAEWLQLSKIKPIDRENDSILTESEQNADIEKQKKIELIDKFIETNPKIVPTKKPTVIPVNIDTSVQENSSLMTETLAKIYLEQKKYQKAIQAYEILILKYPEKSSFFADQISDIKALQQHNS
ncbi:tetratricopeptide repeat protein [Myroides sp. N17-2]|uniref:tetratricopeptide repeat protein n=1 Tax=Myroides sp. N17-2 TaxID=2030799 RepID=UPI000EFCA03D|nr:tetratricopeptide repeat protein [Myroides sp. N17-2]